MQKGKNTITRCVSLPRGLDAVLQAEAVKRERSVSWITKTALQEYFAARGENVA